MITDLTAEHPKKTLWRFALPMFISVMFQQFYNIADSSIAGRFAGEDALAAVGASYPITVIFMAFAVGSNLGASVVVSRLFGAKDIGRMKTAVYTAFIACGAMSLILTMLGYAFCGDMMRLIHTPDNIFADGELYLKIYVYGLTFLFLYNVCTGIFTALGDSRTPLYLLIFSSILNVVLDIISVTWLGMGVDGVAIATVMAQGISALISFGLLLRKLKGYERAQEDGFRFYDRAMLGSGTRIAVPSILQQSIVSIGMLLVQSVVNGFGSAALAGYSAGSRIESICVVPMIATGNAVSTFTAQNIGAGKLERVKEGYRASYRIILGFAVIIAVVVSLSNGAVIASFLGGDMSPEAYAAGTGYLSFIAYFFLFIGLKAVTDGVLRGSGDVLVFTIANLVNLGIRVFAAFHFAPVWGVAAVWYAVPMGWIANYVISFSRYLTGKWKDKKVI